MPDPNITAILDAHGYQGQPAEWRTTSTPPIPPDRFGKDHYSTLLYVETRAVDHKGLIAHDHMRCHGTRHPLLLLAKRRAIAFGTDMADGRGYPTRLLDGEQPDHDDYDCLDDMRAAGWLTVTMPTPDYKEDVYRDPWGKIVTVDGDRIEPSFLTGYQELWLCARAAWGLTDAGREVTTALRKHKEEGGTYATFRLPGRHA